MSQIRNILLITSDEMRGDAPGYAGNPDCRTPHLDALAAEGTQFDRHFAVFPKCVPSRVAMLTGRYCHTDAIRTVNGTNTITRGTPNVVSYLRQKLGYETAVFGLNHVWEDEWFYKERGPEAVVDHNSFSDPALEKMAFRVPSYPPQNPDTPRMTEEMQDFLHSGGCTTEGKRGFHDENRTEQAIYYLRELRDRSKPFYLQLNLSKPHPPYRIHEPYYSMYDRAGIRPYPYELPENAPVAVRAQREYRTGFEIREEWLRETQCIYYGMCTFIDDLVGKVLGTLKEQGLADETLIIFTSDHGDYAGQYGLLEKFDTDMRECLLRVPMIIAGPGIPAGKKISGLTEHVDLPETIFQAIGHQMEDPEWYWHGSSLYPVIEGSSPGKDAVFADGGHEEPMRARLSMPAWQEKDGRQVKSTGGKQLTYREEPDSMARTKMIRTAEWKLVVRETGDDELYHLPSDPDEMRNVINEPGHEQLIRDLQRRMLTWCLKTDTDRPYQDKVGA